MRVRIPPSVRVSFGRTCLEMNDVAAPGEVFVCTNCGRRSFDRLGRRKIHSGWDMSCSLRAVKYREADLVLKPNGTAYVKPGAVALSMAS